MDNSIPIEAKYLLRAIHRRHVFVNEEAVIVKPNFIKLLQKIYEYIELYVDPAIQQSTKKKIHKHFLTIINRYHCKSTRSTSSVTSLYHCNIWMLCDFLNFKFTKDIVSLPYWKSVSRMQHGKGLPNLILLKELYDFCNVHQIPFTSVSGMQAGKGLPHLILLKELYDLARFNNFKWKSLTSKQLGVESSIKFIRS